NRPVNSPSVTSGRSPCRAPAEVTLRGGTPGPPRIPPMANTSLRRLVHVLHRSAAADGPTDAQLARRVAAGRDQAAFATLVRRHGPAVRAACRRVVGDGPDAALLRLVPDLPVKGHVVDLEGRGVPGVTVALGSILCGRTADGRPIPFDAPSGSHEWGTNMD